MKRLSLYLFLVFFSLQTPSQADDIRDFQIEGISIGDSLQNYIDNNKFKYYEAADYFKDNKITLYETQLSDFQDFDAKAIFLLSSDHVIPGLSICSSSNSEFRSP